MKPRDQNSYIQVQPLGGFDQPLTYLTDQKTRSSLKLGSLVSIPLGKRKVSGIVWSFENQNQPDKFKVRKILSIIQSTPVITSDLMHLASWISQYYACSKESCLEAMIPAPIRDGMQAKSRRLISLDKSKADQVSISTRATSQLKVIKFLSEHKKPINVTELIKLTSASSATITSLVKKGIVVESKEIVERTAYDDEFLDSTAKVDHSIELTNEQIRAVNEINENLNEMAFKTRLLQGVTGSGKTEVYFEAMENALKQGGSVLFLVPEVTLAPQTVSRLRMRFGSEKVVVWHSHLSAGERLDAWKNVITAKSRIVVGARSAIFAPLPKLRLIIVDEEHETAYKQEDTPRYHARDIAVLRAKNTNALCLLGSATPSLESINNVNRGKYSISQLSKRVDNRELPLIHLIDMRREAEKQRSYLNLLWKPYVKDA